MSVSFLILSFSYILWHSEAIKEPKQNGLSTRRKKMKKKIILIHSFCTISYCFLMLLLEDIYFSSLHLFSLKLKVAKEGYSTNGIKKNTASLQKVKIICLVSLKIWKTAIILSTRSLCRVVCSWWKKNGSSRDLSERSKIQFWNLSGNAVHFMQPNTKQFIHL